MTNNSDYEKGMSAVTRRFTENGLSQMQSTSIGGAGLSTAIVLLLFQSNITSIALTLALYMAAFGIPAWVASWQMIAAYSFYGKESYHHFNRASASIVAIVFFLLGAMSLFLSVAALIWHMSHAASLLFILFSIFCVFVITRHNNSVKAAVERGPGSGA
jgi:hypothetical protein